MALLARGCAGLGAEQSLVLPYLVRLPMPGTVSPQAAGHLLLCVAEYRAACNVGHAWLFPLQNLPGTGMSTPATSSLDRFSQAWTLACDVLGDGPRLAHLLQLCGADVVQLAVSRYCAPVCRSNALAISS